MVTGQGARKRPWPPMPGKRTQLQMPRKRLWPPLLRRREPDASSRFLPWPRYSCLVPGFSLPDRRPMWNWLPRKKARSDTPQTRRFLPWNLPYTPAP